MTDLSVASDFPEPTREAWAGLVDKVLKGADFEKRLVSHTFDGLRIEPLYPRSERAEPIRRAHHAPWQVAQRADHPDPAGANALALADLEGGADALVLSFAGAPTARGFGLRRVDPDTFDRALAGVALDMIAIRVEAGLQGGEAARGLVDLAARRGHDLATLDIDLGLDPVGALASSGGMSAPWPVVGPRLAGMLAEMSSRGFAGRIALADGRPYHEAGASEAQELACVMATGVAYLRAIEAGGHALAAASRAIGFLLVADADEFLTIAKFRAMRRLWARVEAASGLDARPIRLHAETAWRMATRRDPWVNLLRGTLAAFSAGIGGCDAVTVLPFTAALGLPDAFARRLARNTQLLLLEEANLWRVADPVAGSGGFEALTEALASEAWKRFQDIEREGGIVESLRAGAVQGRIAATRSRRERDIATRRAPITGTSEFPHVGETPVAVLMPRSVANPDGWTDSTGRGDRRDKAFSVVPLPSSRDAGGFERLRDRSDDILAATGTRPRVLLANLGSIADFSARATFATSAFEAVGVEAVTNDGFAESTALAEAFAASGCRIACLCSSDDVYATQAALSAAALVQAGASLIYLAGRPGDAEAEWRAAGVRGFVFVGSDVPVVLGDALEASAGA